MSYGTRLCCISMRSNALSVSLALSYVYAMYTRECVYTCVYACGGLFLNRSKTIFRVSLSRSAHQRLTLTSTVLRFRGPRGIHKSEHLEFLDSFFPRDQLHSRDIINRRFSFSLYEILLLLLLLFLPRSRCCTLAVDNKAQSTYIQLLRQQR